MAKRKSNSTVDQIMDMVIDITDMSWKIGAFFSALFAWLCLFTLGVAIKKSQPTDVIDALSAVNHAVSWLYGVISLMLLGITIMLIKRTMTSYRKQNRF